MSNTLSDSLELRTVDQARRNLSERFQLVGVPSPDYDARELVQLVTQLSRSQLLTQANQPLGAERWSIVDALARRREAREPLQYLLGEVEWADLRLKVLPAALIPRPETELLLHLALKAVQGWPVVRMLDVGTGTGALALGFKQFCPTAQVVASDISPQALELARFNAELNGLDVTFVQADVLSSIAGPFDLLLSNPPYLPEGDQLNAQPEVQYDPALALYSGPDGLSLARRLCRGAVRVLAHGGVMLLELDPRNVGVLARELENAGWQTQVSADLSGRERFLQARRGEDSP